MFPHGYREAPARPNVACGKTPLQTKPSHSKGSEFRLCRKIAQSEAKTQIWTGLCCVSLLDLLSQNTRNSPDSQNSQGIQDHTGPHRTTRNHPEPPGTTRRPESKSLPPSSREGGTRLRGVVRPGGCLWSRQRPQGATSRGLQRCLVPPGWSALLATPQNPTQRPMELCTTPGVRVNPCNFGSPN